MSEAKVKELEAQVKEGQEKHAALTKSFNAVLERLNKTPASSQPSKEAVFGTPHIRQGEDPLTSRGFSFLKMMGLVTGDLTEQEAKVEMDMHRRMHSCIHDGLTGGSQYKYGGQGVVGQRGGKFLAPLAPSFFPDQLVDRSFRSEMKALVNAGTDGATAEECAWMKKRHLKSLGYDTKALSWLNELTGGALVAPPEMGELIELLRNKEALVNAGARVVPLPPQGRMVFPRQTAASNTFWVGENSPITESIIGTGEVTLQAKKLAVLIKAPNELIRFASPAAEALLRDDMTKSLALGLDLAGLEGAGGDHRPRGVINFQNITKINSSAPAVNGDAVAGKDIYRFISAVEEANAEFEAFVMRPKTLYKYYQLRADSVAQGDQSGAFLFNLIREAQDKALPTLAGYPVVKSTQVSQVRSKGNNSSLTYIVGGMWSDLLIGMFGAIEFAATTMGDTAFAFDQTWVRGILSADIQARHEAAFCWMDNIDTTI
jgi:HK97 family phage major capsid protein